MIGVTLRQLHYFDAVARIGHFGRAAEACAVTQPALSMQVQELESQLGVILVERSRKGIVLTEDGRAVAEKAARILLDVQDLVDRARHSTKVLGGKLRFGVIPTVAPYLLPALLPKMNETFPDLELHVRETQTTVLLTELADGKLDVIFLALPISSPELESLALIEDKFLLAVPRSYQGRGRVALTDEFLRSRRLLLLEEGHCFRDQALSYCGLQEASTVNTLGASTFATIVRMVANGLGITFLPEMSISTEIRNKDIRLLRLAAPEPKRMLGLAWRKTSPRKRDFEELGKLIRKLKI
jgi:LysR family transcriptional regulator, hydrogen peroxide-inducible genes activator